jgi:hypothetical protein
MTFNISVNVLVLPHRVCQVYKCFGNDDVRKAGIRSWRRQAKRSKAGNRRRGRGPLNVLMTNIITITTMTKETTTTLVVVVLLLYCLL